MPPRASSLQTLIILSPCIVAQKPRAIGEEVTVEKSVARQLIGDKQARAKDSKEPAKKK